MSKNTLSILCFIFLMSAVFYPAVSFGDMGPYPIISTSGNQQNPAIHNNLVVYQDDRGGESNISIADISKNPKGRVPWASPVGE